MSSASKIAMAALDRSLRRRFGTTPRASLVLGWVGLALVGTAACTPKLPPPQTAAKKPNSPETSTAEPAPPGSANQTQAPEAAQPPTPAGNGTLIVIDPGEPDSDRPPSLVEASKREKERKAQAGKPVAVITDENLPRLAKKGQITFADLSKLKTAEKTETPDATTLEQERYWRGRARTIRQRWRDALDEGVTLERQAADLRRKFYAEADPFRRDGEIKPSWDRTLDRLRLTKERADAAKKELDDLLEEGRRAGALPGWLREGAELEPEPPAPPKTTAEAIEPPELKPKDEM